MHSAARPDDKPRRIEVNRILNDDGSSVVLVQDMSYGPGVGWYAQKTIRLDDAQVNAVLRKLCCARQRPGARNAARLDLPCISQEPAAAKATERQIVEPAEIIEFDRRG